MSADFRTSLFASLKARYSRLARIGGYLAAVMVVALLWLSLIGLPDFMTRWILAGANGGDIFIEAHDVSLDLGGGFKARNVCIYRKGIPGPPFFETRECRILYHLFMRPRSGHSRIKELHVDNGILRPLWSSTGFGSIRNPAYTNTVAMGKFGASSLGDIDLDVSLHRFDILGVWVERVKTSVRIDADGVFLSRLSGTIGRDLHAGAMEGTLAWGREGHASGRLATSFDPRALIPACRVFYPEAIVVLDRFSFPTTPPRIDFTFESNSRPAYSVAVKGRIQASNYAYLGAVIGFGNMNVEYAFGSRTNLMKLDPFGVAIGGRQARGSVEFDFESGMADFHVSSDVNLASVVRILGLKEYLLEPWAFEDGTHIEAAGRLGLSQPGKSKVEARVVGHKIGYKGITVNDYSFNYNNLGFKHSFSDFRGNLGGGSVSGSAVMMADRTGTNWTADIKTEIINAETDELLRIVHTNLDWRVGGKVFGNLELCGIGADLVGSGRLTIRGTRIFKSHFGASLLGKWGATSRDFDLTEVPADGRFAFDLNQRRISSRDLFIEFGSVGLTAQGSCGLDGTLEWTLQPVLLKENSAWGRTVLAFLTARNPARHVLTGTIEKPEWRPIPNRSPE